MEWFVTAVTLLVCGGLLTAQFIVVRRPRPFLQQLWAAPPVGGLFVAVELFPRYGFWNSWSDWAFGVAVVSVWVMLFYQLSTNPCLPDEDEPPGRHRAPA